MKRVILRLFAGLLLALNVSGALAQALPATGLLRAASPFNDVPSQIINLSPAYALTMCGSDSFYIGSGDMSELRLVANNFYVSASSVINPGNTLTYAPDTLNVSDTNGVYIQQVSPPLTIPVTWTAAGGGATVTLADGAYNVVSDPVLPSAFGLTKFPVGKKYYVRWRAQVPNTGTAQLVRRSIAPDTGDSQTIDRYFDPGNGDCNNLSGSGGITYTGAGPFTTQPGPVPLVVGKFVSGDPRTWGGVGDSIFDGTGDSNTGAVGQGYFERAVTSATPTVYPFGAINFARGGGTVIAWVGAGGTTPATQLLALLQYVNGIGFEYGTNNFPTLNAANVSNATVDGYTALDVAMWAYARASAVTGSNVAPFKIICSLLMPHVANPPSGNLPANQTLYGPQWDVSGNVDYYNTSRLAQLGLPTGCDSIYSPAQFVRAIANDNTQTDYHKWPLGAGSAIDGLHETPLGTIPNGLGLRKMMMAY